MDPSRESGPPDTIDARLLRSYLADHLALCSAAEARARRMAQWYATLPIGPDLRRIADELDEEHRHLTGLVDRLQLPQPRAVQRLARVAEVLGRLKTNGRGLLPSPKTPLLELEAMRGVITVQQGVWQTLAVYADELRLDPAECRRRDEAADARRATLERAHSTIRGGALRRTG